MISVCALICGYNLVGAGYTHSSEIRQPANGLSAAGPCGLQVRAIEKHADESADS